MQCSRDVILVTFLLVLHQTLVFGCLITNCPRGGKRGGKLALETNIKQCVSCGPGQSGQCFGPHICCGPFGCLMGTAETTVCKRDGYFHELEPCIAGSMSCRRNMGRCATDGLCCDQDSCHVDRLCASDEKIRARGNIEPLELFKLINYQAPEYNSE
ncbi:hypothetical protein PPYR_12571 [Photinus pyralis]|uniref:Uncharacterized protein n=1 Tax=Photinus pyralis TaxID=7054 RepID=A0A5N4A6L2_PHOPY|nr:oxytocin-neurophysin 1-like [Photinus pyralis]KAB0792951.1 hypothetical protein PPYR_12571 [Photinus pyralis]